MTDIEIQLQPLPAESGSRIQVGWDQALQTYYTQVTSGTDPSNTSAADAAADVGADVGADTGAATVFRIGSSRGEITEPREAVDAARRFAEIPDDLEHLLVAGRAATHPDSMDLRTAARGLREDEAAAVGRTPLEHPQHGESRHEDRAEDAAADMGFGFG